MGRHDSVSPILRPFISTFIDDTSERAGQLLAESEFDGISICPKLSTFPSSIAEVTGEREVGDEDPADDGQCSGNGAAEDF